MKNHWLWAFVGAIVGASVLGLVLLACGWNFSSGSESTELKTWVPLRTSGVTPVAVPGEQMLLMTRGFPAEEVQKLTEFLAATAPAAGTGGGGGFLLSGEAAKRFDETKAVLLNKNNTAELYHQLDAARRCLLVLNVPSTRTAEQAQMYDHLRMVLDEVATDAYGAARGRYEAAVHLVEDYRVTSAAHLATVQRAHMFAVPHAYVAELQKAWKSSP